MPAIGAIHDLIEGTYPPAPGGPRGHRPGRGRTHHIELSGHRYATAILADLRHPAGTLSHHNTLQMLDARQPTALLMLAVLPFIPDNEAYRAVAQIVDWLPAGSYIAVSHPDVDTLGAEAATTLTEVYLSSSVPTGRLARPGADPAFLHRPGLVGPGLVGPGLVAVAHWHPDAIPGGVEDQRRAVALLGGVARKPRTDR